MAEKSKSLIHDEELRREMLARLRRIEGQVRGVYKMIQEERNCADIVIQLAAIKAAVSRAGANGLACYLAECVEEGLENKREIKDVLKELMPTFKKFY